MLRDEGGWTSEEKRVTSSRISAEEDVTVEVEGLEQGQKRHEDGKSLATRETSPSSSKVQSSRDSSLSQELMTPLSPHMELEKEQVSHPGCVLRGCFQFLSCLSGFRSSSKESATSVNLDFDQQDPEASSSGQNSSKKSSSSSRKTRWKWDRTESIKALHSTAWRQGLVYITENRLEELERVVQEVDFQRAIVAWRNRTGESLLHVLCRVEEEQVLSILCRHLERQTKLVLLNRMTDMERGFLPIHTASASANPRIVRLLLENGAKVKHVYDRYGLTPLHRAAISSSEGAAECCQLLLDAGANPFELDNAGYSAWHKACFHTSIVVLRVMLQFILDHDQRESLRKTELVGVNGKTSFHLVATFGTKHIEAVVGLLAEYPDIVNINAKGPGGYTPLHDAAVIGNVVATEALIGHGADVNATNSNLEIPLHLAIRANQPRVCEIYLRNGRVNLEAKDQNGTTPRAAAVEENRFEILDIFDNPDITRERLETTPLPVHPSSRARKSRVSTLLPSFFSLPSYGSSSSRTPSSRPPSIDE